MFNVIHCTSIVQTQEYGNLKGHAYAAIKIYLNCYTQTMWKLRNNKIFPEYGIYT